MTTTNIEVPLQEVFPLFQCSVCHGVPMFPPVHSCSRGHNVCYCCMDLVNNHCNECKEPLSVRNTFLEEFLASTTFAELMNSTGSGEMTVGTAASQTMENIVTDECAAQLLVSGRTVSCPFPCPARITASGLYRHFEFGHPEVLLGMLCKNRPFNVVIPGELLAECPRVSRCLYILVVDIADDNNEDSDLGLLDPFYCEI
ncbi:uncharacterized protein LOC129002322 [Macrosteles quadrilineatus]|uniref:uncharacterized protein LOC129002322 n=1 Tax=Macrosteles quadrilineatus TaxID=74068 RepID=UPI0023E0BCC0|nr:uncharacterized protein LOC129002322 [Macrosteles quadrilineatus]